MQVNCKICAAESNQYLKTRVLGKHDVTYYKCPNCNFIFTEAPYWLDEAYSSAITSLDLGLTYRNVFWAPVVEAIIRKWFPVNKNFLDFGGGYGMFVRLMRDRGFSFYRQDIYCENIFAQHFDLSDNLDEEPYELVTAFEVFEHLVEPKETLLQMLSLGKSVLFTTELQPNDHVTPENWWYFIPDTGQHVSLYSLKSLIWLAKSFKLNLYTDKRGIHLLTPKVINRQLFRLLTQPRNATIFSKLHPHNLKSLLDDDFKKVAGFEK